MSTRRIVLREDTDKRYIELVSKITGIPVDKVSHVYGAFYQVKQERKRPPREPAPEGGICLREAARKYGIGSTTLSRWIKNKDIPTLKITRNEVYTDKHYLAEIMLVYKHLMGRKTFNKALFIVQSRHSSIH